jgi:UDP-N-acetyl-D-mannosaminuronic acid dehydrogenase
VIGLAFKGQPATSDIRFSSAVDLIEGLPNRQQVVVKDFVVPMEESATLGVRVVDDIYEGFEGADAVLIMNNHLDNGRFNLYRALTSMRRPALFFDGWNMFNQSDIERIESVYYSTLGYLTRRRGK